MFVRQDAGGGGALRLVLIVAGGQSQQPLGDGRLTPGDRIGAYSKFFWECSFSDPAVNRVPPKAGYVEHFIEAKETVDTLCCHLYLLAACGLSVIGKGRNEKPGAGSGFQVFMRLWRLRQEYFYATQCRQ